VAPEDSYHAKETIEEEFSLEIEVHQIDRVIIEEDLTIVAAVGENMRHTPGIAGRLFQILGKNSINVVAIAQGSSELNISAVIAQEDEDRALNAMHAAFFKKRSKAINVFLVGTGRVGGALVKQMQDYITRSSDRKKYELNILGLANSRKMYFERGGITESSWKDLLDQSDASMELSQFIREMRAINLSNCVFVDCTSSNEIADGYAEILKAGISVVTANKKANSDRFEKYVLLRDLAESNELQYLYETNVCAGLPVIHTIQDLLNVGDTIHKIEAVVSGTLSYIFNSFTGDRNFSEIVIEAHQKGYTEPDPRDDLDGMDMVRKLLILARESGVPLELEQVENQKFLPEDFFNVETVDEFIEELKTYDSQMEEKRKQAEQEGKTLQYIASLEDGKAEIALKAIDESHPFYQLTCNDNIIALTTRLYNETPMVIQGPGAGPEVTAAGVFTDILKAGTQIFKNSEEGEV
jgi:aspartokinase/homoserine dehydrogenase 1